MPEFRRYTRIVAVKLTVVTAVRNAVAEGRRSELVRCIESVARLKTEHEHLVYDGASTDGTADLLRQLEKTTPGLKVVSEPDTGIYNALNKGVRDARGDWFYVLGCDDWICSAETLARLLASTPNRIQMVVAPVARTGERYQFHQINDLRWIFWRHPYCHQGVVAKTAAIRQLGGFDESYRLCADGDLCLKFHETWMPIRYSFDEFANYAADGASEKNGTETWREITCVLQRHLHMTDAETARYRQVGYPPPRIMVPFLFHKDLAFRIGARFMLRRWARHGIRSLGRPVPQGWKRFGKKLLGGLHS